MGNDDHAILRWPLFCVVGFFLIPVVVFGTMNGFEYLFFFFPITIGIGLVGLFVTVVAGVVAFSAAWRRAWKRCLSAMILPLCVALGALNFGSLWEIWRNSGDRLYFERQKTDYLELIEKDHANKGKRLMVFPGGGWSGVAGRVYVFDESDEILLDEKHRSADFQRRMDATELSCNAAVFPLEGHFYKAFISC